MELSWPIKLRIALTAAIGVTVIGILGWPLVAPADPLGVVRASNLTAGGAIVLLILAFGVGFAAYFLSWPYGREIGILAAPSGLAVWALRSGSVAGVIQLHPTLAQRYELLAALRWEPIFWLLVVAAGFAGVLCAQRIHPVAKTTEPQAKFRSIRHTHLNAPFAVVASIVVAQLCIGILAQDIKTSDSQFGAVVSQPATSQIIFAVLVSFGIAAFLVKAFLDVGYVWPVMASGLLSAFVITFYAKQQVLQHLVQYWPATFCTNPAMFILPMQLVAFGTLGSIAGYWLAIRYVRGRKQETK
jgi:hypothetical protein